MNIAFVSHNRCGLNPGGLQQQIYMSAEGLRALGHNVVFWNSWEGVGPGEYDVAHFFSADHTLLPVHQAFAERGIPTVLSPVLAAGNLSKSMQQLRRSLALSRLPAYQDLARVIALVRQASVVVALHQKEQKLCRFYGRSKEIVQIPNGVADIFFRGDPELGCRIVGAEGYFIHVGQFWPNKGQRWLIDNWEEDASLVLIGEVPMGQAPYYQACVTAGKGRRVHFLGGYPPDSESLAGLYAGARGLIINSKSEVAPLVINEAFAAGTPVIMPRHLVSDPRRAPDAVFAYGDVASFRAALSGVGTARSGRVIVTWGEVAHSLSNIYERVGS